MNKSELIAFEYLKNKGIKVINNTGKGTPDFLGEKKNYEVKKLYGTQLIFYHEQIKKTADKCDIIVVDEGKIISIKNYKETAKIFKIKIVPKHEGHNIILKLKDKDFFNLLKCKHKIQDFSQKKITWEEFIMLMTIRRRLKC